MTALLIITTVTTLPALASVPELGFALQLAAVGAALGSAVALRAKHRTRTADTWQITTAWATVGLVIGVVVALLSLVL